MRVVFMWIVLLLLLASVQGVMLEAQTLSGCPVFPSNNVWNTRVDNLPVHPSSDNYVSRIGTSSAGHADFGSGLWDGGPIGIPFVVVPGTQPLVPITFTYSSESDPGPYPIPSTAPIEGGSQSTGDRHVLVLDQGHCILYEVYNANPQQGGSWTAGSGAVFNLTSNALRPSTWTSADAAGLPILPGLARYDEVAAGEIRHALRFTAPNTQGSFIWPACHQASGITDQSYPPMGARFRLKANFDISGFSADTQIILRALKTYGMILADNGSAWYVSGAPDERWNNDHLSEFGRLRGNNFEAVDESSLMINSNSGQSAATSAGTSSKVGIFRSGFFWIEDADGNQQFTSPPDRTFAFGGVPGDLPISGDWNGSGTSKVGIYRASNGLFILDYDGDGQFTAADKVYNLGVGTQAGDLPIVGDWNGDGKTKIGLFRSGYFWILDYNGNGVFQQGVDKTYAFGGVTGDVPVVGDWNGSGTAKIGIFRSGYFWILDANGNGSLDNVNAAGGDQAFAFGGIPNDVPVVGDWNGDGKSKAGLFRSGFFWVLDANGNHSFDGTGAGQDLAFPFGGMQGDRPIVGKW